MTETPRTARVAVIMAAYNAEATLRQAARSVVENGGASDLVDLVVVDDASRVPAADALGGLGPNVQVIRMGENGGPSAARNRALEWVLARGYDYVAILDADDVARPGRFAAQAAFLDDHADVGAVGTWVNLVDEDTFASVYEQRMPTDDAGIRAAMFFNLALGHPTLMARTDLFRRHGGYDVAFRTAEDYELLRRFQRHTRFANLPAVLIDYRLSRRGQSLGNRRRQLWDRLKVQFRYFEPLEWRAWAGVAKTLALIAVPTGVLMKLKARLSPAVAV